MATREDYRNDLNDKIVGLEDEGYGDFEYTPGELNTYLALALSALYPHVYATYQDPTKTVTSYGTLLLGSVTATYSSRVFLVEDSTERDTVTGWKIRPGEIINIDTEVHPSVNLYYYDAYAMPADDVTDVGLPTLYTPLLVLGALVQALESRHDTGVRGDPPPTGPHEEFRLIQVLSKRYEQLLSDMSMSLPALVV